MAKRITGRGEALDNYAINYGTRETPLMRRLRADTQEMTARNMQIGPDQGALLSLLSTWITTVLDKQQRDAGTRSHSKTTLTKYASSHTVFETWGMMSGVFSADRLQGWRSLRERNYNLRNEASLWYTDTTLAAKMNKCWQKCL